MALAIPDLYSIYEKTVILTRRLVPDEVDIDAQIAAAVAEMAAELDVAAATSFDDIATASAKLGLEPEALRARCRRVQTKERGEVVARLGAGVVGYKLGRSWKTGLLDVLASTSANRTIGEVWKCSC